MKLDADLILHYIAIVREIFKGIISLAMIVGGLALIWFAGCAIA